MKIYKGEFDKKLELQIAPSVMSCPGRNRKNYKG